MYYCEEFKYARGLGYTVIPISGYLFERMESPFRDFVSSLFESRLEARISGNEAMSYVYKILMNSLYGRFGINPKSTTTEVCDKDRYKHLIRHSEFIFGDMLSENNYIVAYHSNTEKGSDYWNPPKNSAVQLAAAITASALIYMYPYISREDCYYTDTDSGQPLPKEVISSSVLGKFKLEDRVMKGYFLAPKSKRLTTLARSNILKYKGPAKNQVNQEWFESQYADPSRTKQVPVEANFRIDWHTLNIIKKDTMVRVGLQLGTKRIPVYHRDVWVDTDGSKGATRKSLSRYSVPCSVSADMDELKKGEDYLARCYIAVPSSYGLGYQSTSNRRTHPLISRVYVIRVEAGDQGRTHLSNRFPVVSRCPNP